MLYERLCDLPLTVERYQLEPLRLDTQNFVRHSTVVHLHGPAGTGSGEDITYAEESQLDFQQHGRELSLAGEWTVESFSRHLDGLDLRTSTVDDHAAPLHRRWAFESAALDLALRQAGKSLGEALGRTPKPLTFSVSLGLGRLETVRSRYPDARFKVDLAENWTEETVDMLAGLGCVDVVDLKGQYRGSFKGPGANPEQYRWIAEKLPEVWLEDPWLDENTRPVLAPHRERITWDATLHAVADILQCEHPPRCVNIKPSRFGFVSELMRTYEYCEGRGIEMYGGGQFELGVGRGQIQLLAALFHPETPNDVAPSAYNDVDLRADLPVSPLAEVAAAVGFRGQS